MANPNQARDEEGKWTEAGRAAKSAALQRDKMLSKFKQTSSGMYKGTEEEGQQFIIGSEIFRTYYHGTGAPDEIEENGIELSTDEVVSQEGISLTRFMEIAEDYATQEEDGKVLSFKIFSENPITIDELRAKVVKELGDWNPSSEQEWAFNNGYDAIIYPKEVRIFDPSNLFLIEGKYPKSKTWKVGF